MTISIDWLTRVISVPKDDLQVVQLLPTEIRQLDLNIFRLILKDLEADEEGIPFLDTHRHNPPVTVGGVTLARVVEIINDYTITFLSGCEIDVAGVTAGNRWCSVTTPASFVNCTFTGSGSTGHAIRITSPGTYSFTGNTFTGFGADGTNYAAIFNDSGGAVTLNLSGGTTPTIRNGTSATTTLVNAVTVKVTVKDVNTGLGIDGARVLLEKVSDGTDILSGTTNSSGVIQDTAYNYVSSTAVTGKARKATSSPLYKTATISGTITSSGLDLTVFMIPDE